MSEPSAPRSLPLCMILHDDHWFLKDCLDALSACEPKLLFISKRAWNGEQGDWQTTAEKGKSAGAEVIIGDWQSEADHRQACLTELKARSLTHVLIPDSDEILTPEILKTLQGIAKEDLADVVRVSMDTYWKSPRYVIRPRERLALTVLINCQTVEHVHTREYRGSRELALGPEFGLMHHLSYAGPIERILKKVRTWSHRNELVPGWIENVWLGWDQNRHLQNLHPTHPNAYGFAERIQTPQILANVRDDVRSYGVDLPGNWPTVSIVIPLYGGSEDIKACLDSLRACSDLIKEIIVVDDCSPDDAPGVVASFGAVTLLKNTENIGFAATCNRGYEASMGEIVLFLNSDTIVPRPGLIRLIEPLIGREKIAATGPVSNNVGHQQRIATTYTSIETMPLFAEDLASSSVPDREVDMLVGFCLAVKKSALEEVGVFDTRFGIGQFEDNDLCYRLRRAGHRLVIAGRSFIHHAGSQSLGRHEVDPTDLLNRNAKVFLDKWRTDLETGYVSNLPGFSSELIRFDESRHPIKIAAERKDLVELADISLCMIVKNEERVLADCLSSVQNVFREIIVVDTGSTDRTVDIARSFGADVYYFPWTESFAEARNESLKYAKGQWICWIDADDTLPYRSAEAILHSVAHAPDSISGFVVPVRFTDAGPGGGTQVDHVKVFRNSPAVRFEGHIHEQILPSLRTLGGDIARIDALVFHSGYDTSEEGQAEKRVRDWPLLEKDLAENPNHPFKLFNLGMTCHYCGMHLEAVDWLQKCIDAAESGESHVRKAYALMGVSYREIGQTEKAMSIFEKGLDVVGPDPELYFNKGVLLSAMGRLEDAKESYLKMSRDIGGHFSSVDVQIFGGKRYFNLANVCRLLGQLKEAREWAIKGIEDHFAPSAYALVDISLEAGDYRTARMALNDVARLDGACEQWAVLGIRVCEASGTSPEEFLRSAVLAFPEADHVRMVLARTLLAQERFGEAESILQRLSQHGMSEASYYLGVAANRAQNLPVALKFMERAYQQNPTHAETAKQVALLRNRLSAC